MAAGMLYATLPPTFYDALVYHLGLPNLYLSSGSLIFPESFSLTPLLGLSAVGLAVGVVFFTSYLRVYAFS